MIVATLTVASSLTWVWPRSSGWAVTQRAIRSAVSSAEFGVEMVEQQREGAAAVARGDVAGADQILEQAGDVAQGGVAGDSAIAFVDRLQFAEIDRDQGRGRAVARGLAQHALELVPELARIEQGGERVAADILVEIAQGGRGRRRARRGAKHFRR